MTVVFSIMTKISRRLIWIVSLLFFLSGFASLAYEVIWFKRFTHVWGNSTLAQAVVLVAFLFGLSLGAWLFGRRADRVRSPLGWYCLCEVLIGLLALLIPYEISMLRPLSSLLYPVLAIHPILQFLPRFFLTFLVIGPSCVLMGGTLPLMIRHFSINDPWGKETTGWLYAFNTLGAAAGCYVAGFHFLPMFGMNGTNWLAATINWFVAAGGYVLLKQRSRSQIPSTLHHGFPASPLPLLLCGEKPLISISRLYAAAAMTGCASLILQVVWTRKLAVLLGGTTYAFSAMLFVFLLGIATGSLFYSLAVKKIRDLALTLIGVISLLVLSVAAGFALLPQITLWVGDLRTLRSHLLLNALVSSAAGMTLQLLPTLCMGFLFPLIVDLVRRESHEVGSAVGNVYTVNTIGSIVGVFLAFFFLMPMSGSYHTAALALSLYLAALLLIFPYSRKKAWRALGLAAILLLLAVWMVSRPLDPLKTDMGLFLYGADYTDTFRREDELIYFKEGGLCNVLVTRFEQEYYLRVNGKIDATKIGDMRMQLGLAYFSRFFHPQAKDILVIGYGSGSTAGASLLFPHTQVICCEIEPAIFEAGYFFADVNHRPYRSPDFQMILDDGRSYLEGCGKQFDLILSEPSNPWMAGISNLFTREFYRQARRSLRPGGILAQWIHTYHFSSEEYRLIARTIVLEFPYAAIIRVNEGDTILLAANHPLLPDGETIQTAQAMIDEIPQATNDLRTHFGSTDVASLLLQVFLLSNEEIRGFLKADQVADVNTDVNLRLEFDAPLRLFLSKADQENVEGTLMGFIDPERWIKRFQRWRGSIEVPDTLHYWLQILAKYDHPNIRNPIADFALTLLSGDIDQTEDSYLLAEKLIRAIEDEAAFHQTLTRLLVLSIDEAYRAGVELWNQKRYAQTVTIFQRILERRPNWATGWTFLALGHAHLQEWRQAEEAFGQAEALAPNDEFYKQSFVKYQTMKDSR
ncbi:MAG: hypothetical protein C4527_02480 [Candidatus Omnitrophota bacterium]|jgi:spermidine synthase|nr:MAG: hypothetical protein C4527_02480 [Candidatus Omnitrophota bacterium]